MSKMNNNSDLFSPSKLFCNAPDSLTPFILADFARKRHKENPNIKIALCFIARDGERLTLISEILRRLTPKRQIITLPAWDCLPYDRVSPNMICSAERMRALSLLASDNLQGAIILTSVNAFIQKLIPKKIVKSLSLSLRAGEIIKSDKIIEWANMNGYLRVPIVREAGEYAVRGSIIDLFPAGEKLPIRFDFFGAQIETIRNFDPDKQRTINNLEKINLIPNSEIILNEKTIINFRKNFANQFSANRLSDPLYGAISSGQRYMGMEHWLPFFYNELERLSDYCPNAPFIFDNQAINAFNERKTQILDYYQARIDADKINKDDNFAPYNAIKPELLYEIASGQSEILPNNELIQISPFSAPKSQVKIVDFKSKIAPSLTAQRKIGEGESNIYQITIELIKKEMALGRKIIIACKSKGSRQRLAKIIGDNGQLDIKLANNWHEALKSGRKNIAFVILPIESGFQNEQILLLSERDILGDIPNRKRKKSKSSDVLTKASALAINDLVVHIDHGIGRFVGLKAIDVAGAPHDCVEIEYAKNDRLYLPVENIELLSRYGSNEAQIELDRLGNIAWQAKKAKLKKRIRDMAEQLIRVAANRAISKAEPITIPHGAYEEFVAKFAFEETQDQLNAICDVFDDLASGKVMDRLICGDVGFGKTEIALRAAFLVALSGRQVALIVPTTLLARQHYKSFSERFSDLPIKVAQLSRLVPNKEQRENKRLLSEGKIDIIIGTHALLAKSIEFQNLGLLIVDEEQHFGVAHKERLKELKNNVHVLTLSATPIPRTLQLALTGVRDLSLLATAPIDRLAIRTFVMPFDALSVREALLREKYRNGQSFYVVPRIRDQEEIARFLREKVPEVSFTIANGQMSAGELDDIMNDFYDGKFDVLISTTIVESGLDIPNANTLIVHKADKFGLSQLYQIRGRIGRSKTRAYALFTVPMHKKLTKNAQKRLEVLQSLEHLGAGFELASHDLDIRGAGNLLGDEQSGHIKEVGFELYQAMLKDAVAALKDGEEEASEAKEWSPQISLGMAVMIPEDYVKDLPVRMQLYRRLGELESEEEIDEFGMELIDRFGKMPQEVKSLLKLTLIKSLCLKANVEKIEAGPKGAIFSLRNNEFANPQALMEFISDISQNVRLRPDQKLVFTRDWPQAKDRLLGVASILVRMIKMVE